MFRPYLSGAGWDFNSIQNPHSHLLGAPWDGQMRRCRVKILQENWDNTSESQVHLMLVSSSAQTQPTILNWRWCIICTLNRSILPVVVHSVNNGGVFLGSLKTENVLIMETQMFAVPTFPLVTALRKKGSSFPANLASSSYFSRPEMTKLQTIKQTFRNKKVSLAAYSTSLLIC